MDRRPCIWVQAPEDEDSYDERSICFRVASDWIGVDGRELVLPVVVFEEDGEDVEPYKAVLKQFGGESLLNEMLMSDADLEEGSEWVLTRTDRRTSVGPLPSD